MGRKAKKITKEEEHEDKPKKVEPMVEEDTDIFSDSFKEILSHFVTLNKEVLTLKSTI
jgi:hypothetical protein